MWNGFYYQHKEEPNSIYNDDCIFAPGAFAIKTDTALPERMEESDWYKINVLTCAAPNIRDMIGKMLNPFARDKQKYLDENDLYRIFYKRIDIN